MWEATIYSYLELLSQYFKKRRRNFMIADNTTGQKKMCSKVPVQLKNALAFRDSSQQTQPPRISVTDRCWSLPKIRYMNVPTTTWNNNRWTLERTSCVNVVNVWLGLGKSNKWGLLTFNIWNLHELLSSLLSESIHQRVNRGCRTKLLAQMNRRHQQVQQETVGV